MKCKGIHKNVTFWGNSVQAIQGFPPSRGRLTKICTALKKRGSRNGSRAYRHIKLRNPRCPRCGDGADFQGCSRILGVLVYFTSSGGVNPPCGKVLLSQNACTPQLRRLTFCPLKATAYFQASLFLKIRISNRSGVGQNVADVADAGQVHDHALEAQAEAGVAAAAIAAQVADNTCRSSGFMPSS